jgi:cytochrome c oxidase subunit 4
MTSLKPYVLVTIALFVLLAATIGAAFLDLGPFNTPVAMLIAAAKAAMIVTIFMHLRHADGLVRLFAGVGAFWLAIMILMGLIDFVTRGH